MYVSQQESLTKHFLNVFLIQRWLKNYPKAAQAIISSRPAEVPATTTILGMFPSTRAVATAQTCHTECRTQETGKSKPCI
jgi:hypothetical protein